MKLFDTSSWTGNQLRVTGKICMAAGFIELIFLPISLIGATASAAAVMSSLIMSLLLIGTGNYLYNEGSSVSKVGGDIWRNLWSGEPIFNI